MKKLLILLTLFAGMAFASCDDDEQVLPKTTAEQIAEQILSYGAEVADVYWGDAITPFRDVKFEIKVPFFIIKNDDGSPYYSFLLEKLHYMYFIDSMNCLVLHFE